jgi:hypothetical protein
MADPQFVEVAIGLRGFITFGTLILGYISGLGWVEGRISLSIRGRNAVFAGHEWWNSFEVARKKECNGLEVMSGCGVANLICWVACGVNVISAKLLGGAELPE